MSGIACDSALAAGARRLREMAAAAYPPAVMQVHREIAERQELYRQLERMYDVIHSEAYQRFLWDLRQRRELAREATAAGVAALRDDFDMVSGVLYRYRAAVDPLLYSTFTGGGVSPPVSPSLRRADQRLRRSYQKISETTEAKEGDAPPSRPALLTTEEAFARNEVIEEPGLENGGARSTVEGTQARQRHELGQEAQAALEPALAEVGPRFAEIWRGAQMALASGNPERIRHFSSSCRVLVDSLVEELALRHKRAAGSQSPTVIQDKKPSRKTQLRDLCRTAPGAGDLIEFAEKDIDEVLSTFFDLNRGVHARDPSFTAEQIKALETRTAKHLLFILSLSGKVN